MPVAREEILISTANGAEQQAVFDGATVNENSFDFPVVSVRGTHYVDGGLQIIIVGKGGSSGANGGDSELLKSDLIMFGVVVPGSVSIVACPFDVVEEPAEWFPPNGFESDLFLVAVLVVFVEIVVGDLDLSLWKIGVSDSSGFNSLGGEGAFVEREVVKPVFLYVVGRVLRARGIVWCGVGCWGYLFLVSFS